MPVLSTLLTPEHNLFYHDGIPVDIRYTLEPHQRKDPVSEFLLTPEQFNRAIEELYIEKKNNNRIGCIRIRGKEIERACDNYRSKLTSAERREFVDYLKQQEKAEPAETNSMAMELEHIQNITKEELEQLNEISAKTKVLHILLYKLDSSVELARKLELQERNNELMQQMTAIYKAIRERRTRETNAFVEKHLDELTKD